MAAYKSHLSGDLFIRFIRINQAAEPRIQLIVGAASRPLLQLDIMMFLEHRVDNELLKKLAAKYIWWKSPEDALQFPERIVAQVMELGDYEDVQNMVETLGETQLCDVLQHADPGVFSARSWAYWHYRLQRVELGHVPPLPQRKVA